MSDDDSKLPSEFIRSLFYRGDEQREKDKVEMEDVVQDIGERMALYDLQRAQEYLKNSMPFLRNKDETKRRLALIQELTLAGDKVRQEVGIFSLGGVDRGIEAIINGDWKECQEIASHWYDWGNPETCINAKDKVLVERYLEPHRPLRDILLKAANEALPSNWREAEEARKDAH